MAAGVGEGCLFLNHRLHNRISFNKLFVWVFTRHNTCSCVGIKKLSAV